MDWVVTHSASFKMISSHSTLVCTQYQKAPQQGGPLTNTLQSYRKDTFQKKNMQTKMYTTGFLHL